MTKPRLKIKESYDYRECRDYLQEKYGCDEQGDFWNWIIDHCDVHNGCYISLIYEEQRDMCNEQQAKILKLYCDEFANEFGDATFWVKW